MARTIELDFHKNIQFSRWYRFSRDESIEVERFNPGVYLIARKKNAEITSSNAKKSDPDIVYIGCALNGVRSRLKSIQDCMFRGKERKHAGCQLIREEHGLPCDWRTYGLYYSFFIGDSFSRNRRKDKEWRDLMVEGKILYLEKHCMAYYWKKHGSLPIGNSR